MHPDSLNTEISKAVVLFNQVWSGSTIAPTARLVKLSGRNTKYLLAVETLFPKGSILDVLYFFYKKVLWYKIQI